MGPQEWRGIGNYKINEWLLSTISTPSVGYRAGILNSDGEEKSNRVDPSKSKDANRGGESDHKLSEEEGELVNDGGKVAWHGNPKLEKSSHGAGHGPFSVLPGPPKTVSSCTSGCSWNSGSVSASRPEMSSGWEVGDASKLKSSKSSASGIGRFALADGGRAKASVHHDSQSNDEASGGKGSETACFLGAQSKPRSFLTAGSLELDSDKRLFREYAEEEEGSFWSESDDGESEKEAGLGDGSKRRLRGKGETG